MPENTKYIVVTGGVLSGLGKGIFTASLAMLLKARGFRVIPVKIDPYVNVDAGTMNPIEHGEVFVLDDGSEVDMDLGTYERFLDLNLRSENNLTTGKIYQKVIEKERKGEYLGRTVQIVPHVTDEIQTWLLSVAKRWKADIEIIEIGGTVGDIENQIFLEATRQLSLREPVVFVHCTLIPIISVVGEQKTKPTQQSVKKLMEMGIQPHFLFCRSPEEIKPRIRRKLSLFCGVPEENIISGPDLSNIYRVPLILERQQLPDKIMKNLSVMRKRKDHIDEWRRFVGMMDSPKRKVRIAITGKYTELHDSYVSIIESLKLSAAKFRAKPEFVWIETTDIDEGKTTPEKELSKVDGVLVPGGFGSRGVEGKIKCIRFARESKKPFLGLCFGFQLAVVEFARHVCGLHDAHTTEVNPETKHPVIDLLPEQRKVYKKGGTMRLGGHDVHIKKPSKAYEIYGKTKIRERFRHRYEFNPAYKDVIEAKGLVFSGCDASGEIMQILELPDHPFFFATQFHPEFTTRVLRPNPVFVEFVRSCLTSG